MQKVLSLLTLILLVSSFAVAQQSNQASHNVTINIPNLLMVRITNGSNAAAPNPAVTFDLVTDIAAFIDAIENNTPLRPTNFVDFDDVIVFSNRATWTVNVTASPISATQLTGLNTDLQGVTLAKISVAPRGSIDTGIVTSRATSWELSEGATFVASGIRTQGWESLGFDGDDYLMNVDGTEDPGNYSTTVTYTISAP